MVPERTGEVAANGDKTGKQDGGEMFARRLTGDGHVSRAHGVHPVAATTQPSVQQHGRPAEPQLYGLSIAPALRFTSAVREPSVGCVAFLLALLKQNGSLMCSLRRPIFNFGLTKTVIKVMAHYGLWKCILQTPNCGPGTSVCEISLFTKRVSPYRDIRIFNLALTFCRVSCLT